MVNLVAILHGDAAAFDHAHVTLVQRLVRACQDAAVSQLVHVSALGAAADAPSLYQRSKAQGEAVLMASSLALTILRPSVVFGAHDRFLNMLASLQAVLPVLPLAGAATRFQPVWVQDVAQAIVNRLRATNPLQPAAAGPLFEACGPEVFTLRALAQLAGRYSGHARPVLALPDALASAQATVMEWLPGEPMMSRDNLASLQRRQRRLGRLARSGRPRRHAGFADGDCTDLSASWHKRPAADDAPPVGAPVKPCPMERMHDE